MTKYSHFESILNHGVNHGKKTSNKISTHNQNAHEHIQLREMLLATSIGNCSSTCYEWNNVKIYKFHGIHMHEVKYTVACKSSKKHLHFPKHFEAAFGHTIFRVNRK